MSDSQRSWTGREYLVQILVLGVWGLLALRLMHIQLYSQETFASRAARQQISHEPIPARPGDLLDRKGRLLATTTSVSSLFVNPSSINDPQPIANEIARVLDLEADKLEEKIKTHSQKKFLWIKRQLSPDQTAAIQQLDLPKEMVGLRDEFKRFYPQESLAVHVLGLRDIDGNGQGGAEEAFDSYLRGQDGVRRFVRDARGNVLEVLEEVTEPPRHGHTVVLTLDTVLQLHTEAALDDLVEEHNPVGACAIVLAPSTGEVLAMASRPGFSTSNLADVPENAWKNLAISAVYEPGSTFKPLVVAWGLDKKVLDTNETFQCEWGSYYMGRRLLHDHHPYGELNLTDVLVKSSNIGMAKIGEKLGNEQLYSLTSSFGFGKKTGLELAGEVPGIVRPLRNWNNYSTGSIPMGHELAVTPIQMISAHAILANGGKKKSPHLLLRTSHESPLPQQIVVSQVISQPVADWVVQHPMKEVVERGTGKRAQLEKLSVFGKTGTAQKVNPNGGYFSNKNVCSFICGAPAENPRFLVLVCVDEPRGSSQFGGTVAAPYAARILKDCLNSTGF